MIYEDLIFNSDDKKINNIDAYHKAANENTPLPKVFINPNINKNSKLHDDKSYNNFIKQEKILAQKLANMNIANSTTNDKNHNNPYIVKDRHDFDVSQEINLKYSRSNRIHKFTRTILVIIILFAATIAIFSNIELLWDIQKNYLLSSEDSIIDSENYPILEFQDELIKSNNYLYPRNYNRENSFIHSNLDNNYVNIPNKKVLLINEEQREELLSN